MPFTDVSVFEVFCVIAFVSLQNVSKAPCGVSLAGGGTRVVRQALFMGGGTFLLTLTVRQLDEHTPEKSLQLLKYLEIGSAREGPE